MNDIMDTRGEEEAKMEQDAEPTIKPLACPKDCTVYKCLYEIPEVQDKTEDTVITTGRLWHTASLVQNPPRIIVIGGQILSQRFNGGAFADDILVFDLATHTWTLAGPRLPFDVAGHTAITIKENDIYIYGGINKQCEYFGHIFLLKTDRIPFALEKLDNISGAVPTAREGHSWNKINDTQILMFGGCGPQSNYPAIKDFMNDVHIFDTTAHKWLNVTNLCKGSRPVPRFYHSAAFLNNKLWIHGGWDGVQRLSDFHVLHLDTYRWEQIVPYDHIPCNPLSPSSGGRFPILARSEHTSIAIGNRVLVFSGRTASSAAGRLCEIGCLDIETCHWSILTPKPPGQRSGQSATLVGDRIYIIGGNHNLTPKDNVFTVKVISAYVPLKKQPIDVTGNVRQDLEYLWNHRDEFTDYNLVAEGTRVPVHRAILSSRCQYFRSLFHSGMRESNALTELVLEDVQLEHLLVLLRFIYTGNLTLLHDSKQDTLSQLKGTLVLSSRMMMEDLVTLCENRLLSYMSAETVVDLLQFASFYSAMNLKANCLNWILNESPEVSAYNLLPKDILQDLRTAKESRF